ncbi:Tetratricopeptide repeat protein 23-like, partial [Bienertia sinuspersici]
MGDINCVVNFDERLGSQVRMHEISPPRECFDECEVQDISYTGCFYTWTNKQDAAARVWSKIDRKLKEVKKELKELNKNNFNGIQAKTEEAYSTLIKAQTALHQDPENVELARIEKEAAEDYNKKNKCFSQFLRQKAKIKWIQEGDDNTRLFHKSLKAQRLKSNIHAIQDLDGNSCNSPDQIARAFSQFYKQLIGSSEMVDRIHVEQH